jgi:hypothetical protein
VEVTKETSPGNDLKWGHVVVGATAAPLALSCSTKRGVIVRAPGSSEEFPNQHAIWVGGAGVTANNSATGGIPILPGTSMTFPVDDPSFLYVISDAEGQDLAWMAI